eukprot:422671-Prymnesium_polylepis.2
MLSAFVPYTAVKVRKGKHKLKCHVTNAIVSAIYWVAVCGVTRSCTAIHPAATTCLVVTQQPTWTDERGKLISAVPCENSASIGRTTTNQHEPA